ncbi:MAG: metallophosphoesterase, partial [Phycisphaerae bacterium]
VGCGVDGFAVEPYWLSVTNTDIRLPRLPQAWDGVRIALLTDLHLGRWIDTDFIAEAVALCNEQKPDIVALTGDIVSRRDAITPAIADVLGELQAPAGKFSVLGNHDYWTDPKMIGGYLASAGFEPVDNDHRTLNRDGRPLHIAGVEDYLEGWPDTQAALGEVPDGECSIVLCHNPDYVEEMPASPSVDLLLCGHSHGGQVNLPLLGRPVLPMRHRKYAAGLNRGPQCPVYTSVGIGVIGIPVRFRCRPEIAILRLRSA